MDQRDQDRPNDLGASDDAHARFKAYVCDVLGDHMVRLRLTLTACMLMLIGPVLAQSIRTNADVIKLIQAGMSNAVIVQSIDATNDARFDTSADALILLKRRGASDEVIQRILSKASATTSASRSPKSSAVERSEGGRCSDNDDTESVMKILDAGKELSLTPSSFNQDTNINPISVLGMALTFGIVKTQVKVLVSIPGTRAGTRLQGNQPLLKDVGVLSNTSADTISLVRLEVKDGNRVIAAEEGSFGVTGDTTRAGYPPESLVPLIPTLTKRGCKYTTQGQTFTLNIYDVAPKEPLPPGEYAMILLGTKQAFDFGVDP